MRPALAALAMTVLFVSGCYRHVVRAEGVGTDQMTIHEPNLEEPADRSSAEQNRALQRRQLERSRRSLPKPPKP